MRLIHTSTLQMRDFPGPKTPPYAILSHRWAKNETTFEDFRENRMQGSLGHQKVLNFCRCARRYGLDWAWVDTCCIDKRNSSELSEAINSMHSFYSRALLCLAHLADVKTGDLTHPVKTCSPLCDDCDAILAQFGKSKWFGRGWTLQELVAPMTVVFLSAEWRVLGTKAAYPAAFPLKSPELYGALPLNTEISDATGITINVLEQPSQLLFRSIAQRLSWAAGRKTTRTEDMAYCLLGILGVNMPLLYGEGELAWMRLQQELIKTSSDESIFAWDDLSRLARLSLPQDSALLPTPILSTSVQQFRHCARIRAIRGIQRPAYTIGNQGVELRLNSGTAFHLKSGEGPAVPESMVVPLNCSGSGPGVALQQPCLLVLQMKACGHWERVSLLQTTDQGDLETLFRKEHLVACEAQILFIHTTVEALGICMARQPVQSQWKPWIVGSWPEKSKL